MGGMPQLKRLDLEDRQLFSDLYKNLKFPLIEHSFAWLYVWIDCYEDIAWATINGNVCLFVTFEGSRCIWNPILPGNKLSETLQECFEICEKYNQKHRLEGKPSLMYLPDELKDAYEALIEFKIKEQNTDYIYERKKIIELKGDKYKSQRNVRNNFIKNNAFSVEHYDSKKHKKQCFDLLKKWHQQKLDAVDNSHAQKLDFEVDANKKVLDLVGQLGLVGIVVLVDNVVVAYSFGEQTNQTMCTDFFEKTDLKIKGLSVFIYGEFLKNFIGKYVNAGEDWDVSYLKATKMHYKPCLMKKSYKVTRK